jgi:hypothetical protein
MSEPNNKVQTKPTIDLGKKEIKGKKEKKLKKEPRPEKKETTFIGEKRTNKKIFGLIKAINDVKKSVKEEKKAKPRKVKIDKTKSLGGKKILEKSMELEEKDDIKEPKKEEDDSSSDINDVKPIEFKTSEIEEPSGADPGEENFACEPFKWENLIDAEMHGKVNTDWKKNMDYVKDLLEELKPEDTKGEAMPVNWMFDEAMAKIVDIKAILDPLQKSNNRPQVQLKNVIASLSEIIVKNKSYPNLANNIQWITSVGMFTIIMSLVKELTRLRTVVAFLATGVEQSQKDLLLKSLRMKERLESVEAPVLEWMLNENNEMVKNEKQIEKEKKEAEVKNKKKEERIQTYKNKGDWLDEEAWNKLNAGQKALKRFNFSDTHQNLTTVQFSMLSKKEKEDFLKAKQEWRVKRKAELDNLVKDEKSKGKAEKDLKRFNFFNSHYIDFYSGEAIEIGNKKRSGSMDFRRRGGRGRGRGANPSRY